MASRNRTRRREYQKAGYTCHVTCMCSRCRVITVKPRETIRAVIKVGRKLPDTTLVDREGNRWIRRDGALFRVVRLVKAPKTPRGHRGMNLPAVNNPTFKALDITRRDRRRYHPRDASLNLPAGTDIPIYNPNHPSTTVREIVGHYPVISGHPTTSQNLAVAGVLERVVLQGPFEPS